MANNGLIKNTTYDYLLKIIIIGNSGVGKSSLLLRFTDNSFSPSFIATIGIDFKIKTIDVDGKCVKLQIWDTAGQERFRGITTAYYRGAQAAMVVYDISDRVSFDAIENIWMKTLTKQLPVLVIGNKSDLTNRQVTIEEGEALATKYDAKFIETSAKNNDNVQAAFIDFATDTFKKYLESKNVTNGVIKLPKPDDDQPEDTRKCCYY